MFSIFSAAKYPLQKWGAFMHQQAKWTFIFFNSPSVLFLKNLNVYLAFISKR